MESTHHFQQAQQAVLRLTSQWRGAPPVTVVANARDIPGVDFDDARGAFRPAHKDVFIVANTQPLAQVADTMVHETLGHHGMREHLGLHWRGFMHAVQGGIRGGDWWLAEVRHDVRRAYVDDYGQPYLTPVQEADEVVAAVTETFFRPESGRIEIKTPIRARVAAARGHFNREILYRDWPVSMLQLLGTILAAEHRLRHGSAWWGIGHRLREWHTARMPKFDPLARPMSLDESQTLLAAEESRRQDWQEWKAMGMFAGAILCGLVALAGILYWVLLIFGGLGSMFR